MSKSNKMILVTDAYTSEPCMIALKDIISIQNKNGVAKILIKNSETEVPDVIYSREPFENIVDKFFN